MAQPPDPTRRLRALRGTAVARPGWVPPPPDPPPVRHSHGTHRRGHRDAIRSSSAEPTSGVAQYGADESTSDDDVLIGLRVKGPASGRTGDRHPGDRHSGDRDTADRDTADGDTADGDTADGDTADRDTSDRDTDDHARTASPPHRLAGGPWGRLAQKWVPESMRDARADPGRRGAVLLSVVAAVAAVVAAVGVWRDRPEPRPVQTAALTTSATTEGAQETTTTSNSSTPMSAFTTVVGSGAAPSAATSDAPSVPTAATAASVAVLYVSVTGLVHKPGLVRLPSGSRVADAIQAAGGLAAHGDLTGMNLAQPLSDGDSVVVGAAPTAPAPGTVAVPDGSTASVPGVTTGPTGSPALINLNTADQAALESLPGVGPVMATTILSWRTEHGAFTSVEQLQEISGIGPARYARLSPLVTV